MRRITQFFLTLLFIMMGVNVVQAQTTVTKTFDFKNATTTAAKGSITLDGVTITLFGNKSVITNGTGLVCKRLHVCVNP